MNELWQLINSPQTFIFGIAIMLMALLFVLEVLSLLLGGINDWVDGFLPDALTEGAQLEAGVNALDAGGFVRFLSWLYVGRVPLLMLIVLFLAVFGLVGYGLQLLAQGVLGVYLPMWLAAVLAWLASLPLLRVCAALLYKILPKDETTAISEAQLVGRVGEIVIGQATHDKSAQVKVKDVHGQTHYVMAFADGDAPLTQGEKVLLVVKEGMYFRAIKNISDVLVD